ncbi:transposase [Paracoccus sp. (in: a-proteobacteria)]|uniref:transposase n=1 Tax=Paracoccus sp. TaxID=267 RepID=UPI0034CFA33A
MPSTTGLTPRRHRSGMIDMQGRILRHGDKLLRSCLHGELSGMIGTVLQHWTAPRTS